MRLGVIGGGGWGTTLAILLESRGHAVTLWVYGVPRSLVMRSSRSRDSARLSRVW